MLHRLAHAFLLVLLLMSTVCNAGILSSEWGMSPYSLSVAKTPELTNKTLESYKSRCMLSAEYSMFKNEMQVEFLFSDGDKNSGELLSVSLTKHFYPTSGSDSLSPKQKLFKKLVDLYTDRYGEPNKSISGGEARSHEVNTYTWFDSKRNNSIELEKRFGYINLDYTPNSGGTENLGKRAIVSNIPILS